MRKKIGWQKYEMMLEEQISSDFISKLIKLNMENLKNETLLQGEEHPEEGQYEEEEEYEEHVETEDKIFLPINNKLIEEAVMASSFDCWVGYTNFDITQSIKEELDKTEGVEILKIMSRYRFFIGIGKMFDFTNVRKNIEYTLTKEKNDE